jgi:hypothetical protein
VLPSYEKIADGRDELDLDGALNESPDPADVADADAFEELAQNNQNFATTTPDQPAINESPDIPDAPNQRPNTMEAGNTEAMLTVVIDHFPSASAGAPIYGMQRGHPVYESRRGTHGDSIWSPFMSECDWSFAQWAKMRGPTSSAVTELLAIPGVRTLLVSIRALLI